MGYERDWTFVDHGGEKIEDGKVSFPDLLRLKITAPSGARLAQAAIGALLDRRWPLEIELSGQLQKNAPPSAAIYVSSDRKGQFYLNLNHPLARGLLTFGGDIAGYQYQTAEWRCVWSVMLSEEEIEALDGEKDPFAIQPDKIVKFETKRRKIGSG